MARNILRELSEKFIKYAITQIVKALWRKIVLTGAVLLVSASSFQALIKSFYATESLAKDVLLILALILGIIIDLTTIWLLFGQKKAETCRKQPVAYRDPQSMEDVESRNLYLKEKCASDSIVVFKEIHGMTLEVAVELNKKIHDFERLYFDFRVASLDHLFRLQAIFRDFEAQRKNLFLDQLNTQDKHRLLLHVSHNYMGKLIGYEDGQELETRDFWRLVS